jgi:predicted transposase YbfD/YdcC
MKNGEWKDPGREVAYLITSLAASEASSEALLCANRSHSAIEIMHRNKDVILGEDGYTNRSDNAPRNIFSLLGFALKKLREQPDGRPVRPAAVVVSIPSMID